jgi:hypothetical protein
MSRFSESGHASRSPDVAGLLQVLNLREIRYVLVGSVAAAAHGIELRPGDLDIVPEGGKPNLENLVGALQEVEARPVGPFGEWKLLETGERRWASRPTTEQELSDWLPDTEDSQTLDHLYATRFGDLDVVPNLAGTYETLRPRASLCTLAGRDVWLAHVDDLLARMTVPRREKDIPRVAQLREIQRRCGTAR